MASLKDQLKRYAEELDERVLDLRDATLEGDWNKAMDLIDPILVGLDMCSYTDEQLKKRMGVQIGPGAGFLGIRSMPMYAGMAPYPNAVPQYEQLTIPFEEDEI